jgi:hypothetical protein
MNKKRWFISGFILAVISIFTIAATDKSVFDQAKLQALLTKITGVLNFDSNTLVVDATNNRVGIGLSSPAGDDFKLSFASGTYNVHVMLMEVAGP